MSEREGLLPKSTDVIIVGCGPVGATLAALLGQQGVNVLVIDKAPSILMMPRAIALDNEALRVLQMIDVGNRDFAQIAIPRVRMHSPVMGNFATANTQGTLDGHPKLVTFYQPELEQAIERRIKACQTVTVCRSSELITFKENEQDVVAMIKGPDGARKAVKCAYLVGADGASSLVRNLIGQGFKGKTFREDWLIVDARRKNARPIDHVEFICDPKRAIPHMPAPGGRERWEFMLHPGETKEQMEHPAKIAELMAPWADKEDLAIERTAVYQFHARCCNAFSRSRVHLVGDAAHITPPFVGQGLVAGLRDVANLGWKLAWVIQGKAQPEILTSYDQERRPHALKMINLARFMGHLVMTRNTVSAFWVHGLMRTARLLPPLRRHLEELEIKPINQFDEGLFRRRRGFRQGRALRAGRQMPQFWLHHQGESKLSDDVFAQGLVMVGFGRDPKSALAPRQIQAWLDAGGRFLHIVERGGQVQRDDQAEDALGAALSRTPKGWLAVVRPDNFVMAEGPASQAQSMIWDCLGLLGEIDTVSILRSS